MADHSRYLGSGEDVPQDFLEVVIECADEMFNDLKDEDVEAEGDINLDRLEEAPWKDSEDERSSSPLSINSAFRDTSRAYRISAPVSGSRDDGAGPSGVANPTSTGVAATVELYNFNARADHLDLIAEHRERERTVMEDEEWTPDMEVGVRLAERTDREVVSSDEHDEGIGGAQGRGSTSARGCGRGGRCAARGSRTGAEWNRGDRFIEIYPNDDDVPPEFKETLESLVRERVARKRSKREKVIRRQQERRQRSRSDTGRRVNVDGDDHDVNGDESDDLSVYQDFMRFCQDEEATNFEWKPMGTFSGEKEAFLVENSGPTQHFESGYQAFRQIWTDDFLEHIASETNRYASSIPQSEQSFHASWYPTNAHEILLLFAFWIMLGIIQMPTIASCFSLNPLLKTEAFRKLFNQQRYWALNRALHFANVMEEDSDKLKLLRPVIEHLNSKFQTLFVPGQNICIDESLTLWKGFLTFLQYIKSKAAKLGIKTFELCDSSTGYLWAFFVYTGKHDSEVALVQKSTLQVLKLIWPLLGKGYTLFMDNYFNSPLLARFLKRNKTDCVGTLRKSRSDVPRIISDMIVKEGNYVARHADDVVVVNFQDKKKSVRVISTYHKMNQNLTATKLGRPSQYKLDLVSDYNAGMGGVDQKDAMLQANLVERKQCLRWYKKMFKRLLNVSVLNSRILVEQSKIMRYNNNVFRLQLVSDIIKHHLRHRPLPNQQRPRVSTERHHHSLDPGRVVCNPGKFHALVKFTKDTEEGPSAPGARRTASTKESVNRRRCVYCRPYPSQTVYECNICKKPLCLGACFINYHTKND